MSTSVKKSVTSVALLALPVHCAQATNRGHLSKAVATSAVERRSETTCREFFATAKLLMTGTQATDVGQWFATSGTKEATDGLTKEKPFNVDATEFCVHTTIGDALGGTTFTPDQRMATIPPVRTVDDAKALCCTDQTTPGTGAGTTSHINVKCSDFIIGGGTVVVNNLASVISTRVQTVAGSTANTLLCGNSGNRAWTADQIVPLTATNTAATAKTTVGSVTAANLAKCCVQTTTCKDLLLFPLVGAPVTKTATTAAATHVTSFWSNNYCGPNRKFKASTDKLYMTGGGNNFVAGGGGGVGATGLPDHTQVNLNEIFEVCCEDVPEPTNGEPGNDGEPGKDGKNSAGALSTTAALFLASIMSYCRE